MLQVIAEYTKEVDIYTAWYKKVRLVIKMLIDNRECVRVRGFSLYPT